MRALLVAAIALVSCASAPVGDSGRDDAARLEMIKSLSGTWVAQGDGNDAKPGTKVLYRVTAGGSAVEETLFAGEPHEMVTVYALDHGRLAMTHFCALGNQPHMEAQPSADPRVITFVCTSLGNGDPAHSMHMHEGEITFVDADHVKSAWTLWGEGKPQDVKHFVLQRAAN